MFIIYGCKGTKIFIIVQYLKWGFDEYLEMRNKMGENRYEKRKSLLKNFLFYEVSSGVEPLYTVLQTVT